jgi:hypothetical protein
VIKAVKYLFLHQLMSIPDHIAKRPRLSYDPDDVNIRLQNFRISDLVGMVSNKALDMLDDDYQFLDEPDEIKQHYVGVDDYIDIESDDDLQRNSGLWNNVQKSRFIESLMIRLPIPLFYFDGSVKPWRVIDGLQRLHTVTGFIRGDFKLGGLEYLAHECTGLRFDDVRFPGYLRDRIYNAEIIAYVINPGTPPDVKYNIFKRINTGGLKLNGQEIRNAFFRGKPADFIKQLAMDNEFRNATNGKVSPKRMVDREYANRFVAFQLFGYELYSGKMDEFLNQAMTHLYEIGTHDFNLLERSFQKTMLRCLEIFKETGFFRYRDGENPGRQPNKAVFDTLTWNLSVLSDTEFEKLASHARNFRIRFRELLNSEPMIKYINDTTSSNKAVKERFSILQNFINNFLNDHSNRTY